MRKTPKMTLMLFLIVLVLNIMIFAVNPTEAKKSHNIDGDPSYDKTPPVNIDFKHTSSTTIKVPKDQPTIQSAIDAANPGDTIFVYNGTYHEHIIIYKTLTLSGQNKSTTIIDSKGTGTPLTITAHNVTVTGFTVKSGPTTLPPPLSGIDISSSGNTISNNIVTDNDFCGIILSNCRNNTIRQNIIANNTAGILLLHSNNNTIYHNNLINNLDHAETYSSLNNTWHKGYPQGGNYWSNRTDADMLSGPHQNETGSDGIRDTPHTIDENNTDRYPLTGMFSKFDVTWEEKTYHITTVCNSTISNLNFGLTHNEQPKKAIYFNVTGPKDTIGFCRIRIPHALLNGNYTVTLDGLPPLMNRTLPASNSTHTYLYFTYIHATHEVVIIPELPTAIILPIFIIVTFIAIILSNRIKSHQKHPWNANNVTKRST